MRYCEPNLPKNNVKKMLVSALLPKNIIKELSMLGVEPVKLGKSARLISELAYHPDILVLNFKAGKWITENKASYCPEFMNELLTSSKYHLGKKYPADCIFNSFIIDNTVFCGSVNTGIYSNIQELKDFNIVSFKQGYAKCSVIIVDKHSFITSDKSIYKKLTKLSYDCLYVSNESIKLNGYSNGFIGGCAGKISEKAIVFTGNIEEHPDYKNIKDFCRNRSVDIYSLSKEQLYDYGSLLPVTE